MSDTLNISQCNIAQLIGESTRFLFHVMLIHISTCIIEKKKEYINKELFKTLMITAMAIILYNLFFRKIIEPKVEKMKLICLDDEKKQVKKLKLDKQDIFISKQRKKINEWKDKERKKRKEKKNNISKENTPRSYSERNKDIQDK